MYMYVYCIILYTNSVNGMVDLFMSNSEVNRTIGLNAALTYVQQGTVHRYAAGFAYLVRHNINHINFLWKSSAEIPIHYSLNVRVPNNEKALKISLTNIKNEGDIPKKLQAFTIWLRCTGARLGELKVEIELSYTWPSGDNSTNLLLIRRKICSADSIENLREQNDVSMLEEETDLNELTQIEYSGGLDEASKKYVPSGFSVSASQVFYVAIGCVCGFIVIVASLVVTYFTKVRKPLIEDQRQCRYYANGCSPGANNQAQPFLRPESRSTVSKYSSPHSGSIYSAVTGHSNMRSNFVPKTPLLCVEPQVINVQSVVQALTVEASQLLLGDILLEGTYGCVKSGVLTYGDDQDSPSGSVIVKSLKNSSATENQKSSFLQEALAFHALPHHRNICQAVAAVFVSDEVPMLCYAHSGMGNLKKFLLRCRGVETGTSITLSTQNLVNMGLQIISALTHLHSHNILHRDVAARNCLINEDLTVQLCDTSLSRDLFVQDYHCLGDRENRPVKWLAIEALEKHHFTSASDVWSFGVLVWELFTLGMQPYADTDPDEVVHLLREGHRLYQPYNCPDELYGVIYCCWGQFANSRPTLPQLNVALDHFHQQLLSYI